MSDVKVSVIIPAYNAAEFIGRAVESVLSQTHRALEVIVVDDGSDDGTADAVSRLAASEARLHLVRMPTSGPAVARNRGMEAISADAEYVMFVDADDYLAPDAVERALSAAQDGAELVLMGFSIYMANMLNQVWAKLFSADLIRRGALRFLDFRWGEDRLFVFDCLERALRVAVLPECRYFYVMHGGESLISRYYEKKPEACCLADSRMQQLCSRFGTQDDAPCRYMFVKSIFSCMTNLFTPSCTLSYGGKREYVRGILRSQQVQQRSRGVYGGAAVRIMCAVMHTRIVWLNMLMFRLVAFTGRAAPKLFMRVKHRK